MSQPFKLSDPNTPSPPYKIGGVWIVAHHEKDDVVLMRFHELVHSNPKDVVPSMRLDGMLAKPSYRDAEANKEIDFTPGALITITDLGPKKGVEMHMANVAPSDKATQLQYEVALSRLGIKEFPKKIPISFLMRADGQFRWKN